MRERISVSQATMILVGFYLGTSVILNAAAAYGPDAWLSEIVSTLFGIVIVSVTGAIARLNPGMTMVEIFVLCFGRKAGKAIALLYVLISCWLTGAVVRIFSFYSNTVNMPETPIIFISSCYLIVIAFAVHKGLEVIGRISEILVVVIIAIILLTTTSIFMDFHAEAFLPFLKDGPVKPVLKGMTGSLVPYSECFFALNILPSVNSRKKNMKVMTLSMLSAGSVYLFLALRNISVLGVELAARNVFPSQKIFRLIPKIDIIPLLDFNVIVSGIIKCSFLLYCTSLMLADIFELKDFKLFVYPLAMFDLMMSLIFFLDLFSQLFFAKVVLNYLYMIIFIAFPIIVLIVSLAKHKIPVQSPLNRE